MTYNDSNPGDKSNAEVQHRAASMQTPLIRNYFILLSLFSLALSFHAIKVYALAENKKSASLLNIYSHAGPNKFKNFVRRALPRVYVPNTTDNTVTVINLANYRVIKTFKTGDDPEHIVPSYDLKTLWILNDYANSVTPIDPNTSLPGKPTPVDNPYNLYFTPDGRFAMVIADKLKRIDFRDPKSMALHDSLVVNCKNMNHMDFTADGRYAIASCELSRKLIKVDLLTHHVVGDLRLGLKHSTIPPMPQDIRCAPNGKTFFVADMMNGGVFVIDPIAFRQLGFIATGIGTHGITVSRDGTLLYIANRGCNKMNDCPRKGPGSIAVVDPNSEKIVARWSIPGGEVPTWEISVAMAKNYGFPENMITRFMFLIQHLEN